MRKIAEENTMVRIYGLFKREEKGREGKISRSTNVAKQRMPSANVFDWLGDRDCKHPRSGHRTCSSSHEMCHPEGSSALPSSPSVSSASPSSAPRSSQRVV